MAVELGGGWKLLICSKMKLEQTAQCRGLHLRLPSLLSSQSRETQQGRGPFPEYDSAEPTLAFDISSITFITPPAQPMSSETWNLGQRRLVQ